VDQYLDLGSGLPTRPATHQSARAVLPAARVAYVDRDPVVTEHGRGLIPAGVRYVQGDLAEPEAILASGDLTGIIDLSRPVCLVLTLVHHVLDPGTARAVTGVLVRALVPGSFLIDTTLTGYAYETVANKGIVAGQTSDTDTTSEMNKTAPASPFHPASLGLLGLGAVGLAIWRRKEDLTD